MPVGLNRALVAEFLGTAGILLAVCGSGALAHSLDQGNVALSVLCVAVTTGCALSALILTFGGISAHFNPIVTIVSAYRKAFSWRQVPAYIAAQVAGAVTGVVLTNLMFNLSPIVISTTTRSTSGQWLAEIIATFGLLGVIYGCGKNKPEALPFAVPAYITAAIYFTASTCFANPAVTIARIFTDTLTGIRPQDVLPYIGSQAIGAVLAVVLFGWLFAQAKPNQETIEAIEEIFADESKTPSQGH